MVVCNSNPSPVQKGVLVGAVLACSPKCRTVGQFGFIRPAPVLQSTVRPSTQLRGGTLRGAGCSATKGSAAEAGLRTCGASSSGAGKSKLEPAGKAARRNSSQASLGLRLSKKASLSASETTIYKLIKFLPLSARLLLEVLQSVPRLQKLVQTYGGMVIRVPRRKWSPATPLALVLGVRGMERFVAAYGGTEVYIPVCADFLRRLRDVNISREFARLQRQGLSRRQTVHTLCKQYDLSESRVRTIVRGH